MSLYASYEIYIDRERCIKCGTCVRECPTNVLAIDKEGRVYPVNELHCTGCRICERVCPTHAIFVRQVEPERFVRGIWTQNIVEKIRYMAKTGRYIVRGYGFMGNQIHFDDFILVPAQLAEPVPVDFYRENVDVEVVIGEGRVKKPLRLKTPVMIAAMSYGATSKEFKLACAKAANMVGTASNTGEGGMVIEHTEDGIRWIEYEYTKPNGALIVQFASGRWGVNVDYLLHSDAIEIKIGQGAKPGMGGHLLGEKVTKEIALARGVPEGTDILSPARHLDVRSRDDLKHLVAIIRDIVDYEKPIIIKLGPGRVYKDVKIAVEADVDAIAVDGSVGGTGAAPEPAIQGLGLPTPVAISEAVKALKDCGVYGDVKLIALGGIRDGVDVVKALALGADAVAMASAIEIAAGCQVCGMCHTGRCPVGICTQDPKLRRRLNIDLTARKIANFLNAVTREVKMLTAAMGHRSIRELSKEDLRALNVSASLMTGVKLAGLESIPTLVFRRSS